MKTYRYTSHDDYEFEDAYDFETSETDLSSIAQEMAQDDYKNNDGWEWDWPRVYTIWDVNGNLLGKVNVIMEMVPEFWATRLPGDDNDK